MRLSLEGFINQIASKMKWLYGICALLSLVALGKSEGEFYFSSSHFNKIFQFVLFFLKWSINNFALQLGNEIAQEALVNAGKAIDLYNELDQVIPWTTIKETLDDLDAHRVDQTKESAELLGKVHTSLLNGFDAYDRLSQSIIEWTGLLTPLLSTYTKLFSAGKSQSQKTILERVLLQGLEKMGVAQEEMAIVSMSLNEADANLTTLLGRLENEFDEKSDYFQTKLRILQLEKHPEIINELPEIEFITEDPDATTTTTTTPAPEVSTKKPNKWIPKWPKFPKMPYIVKPRKPVADKELIAELKKILAGIKQFYVLFEASIKKSVENVEEIKGKLQVQAQELAKSKALVADMPQIDPADEKTRESITEAVNSLIANAKEYRQRHSK